MLKFQLKSMAFERFELKSAEFLSLILEPTKLLMLELESVAFFDQLHGPEWILSNGTVCANDRSQFKD